MPRDAEPWKWEARRGYYAWVHGSRKRLCHLDDGIRAAKRELARLLREAEGGGAGKGRVPTVGEMFALYFADLRRRRDADELGAGSRKDAIRRVADFPDRHLELPADQAKPHHVTEWLGTHPEWGPTTRHDAAAAVHACFRWARRQGHLAADPLDGMPKPAREPRRELVLAPDQWPAVLAAIKSPQFRDLAEFIRETGARPGEAFRMEARHVNLGKRVAVLSRKEHKSGRKTGRPRPIYLSPRAAAILSRLMEERPEGPLFTNGKGKPWNKNSVNCQVRRIRERCGVGREFVAYALRHLFATESLDKGVPVETVAKLLGHSTSEMVSRVYSRLEDMHDHFLDAVDKVRGGGD